MSDRSNSRPRSSHHVTTSLYGAGESSFTKAQWTGVESLFSETRKSYIDPTNKVLQF